MGILVVIMTVKVIGIQWAGTRDAKHPTTCGIVPEGKELSHPHVHSVPDKKHVGYFLICKTSIWTMVSNVPPSSKNLLVYHCLALI